MIQFQIPSIADTSCFIEEVYGFNCHHPRSMQLSFISGFFSCKILSDKKQTTV